MDWIKTKDGLVNLAHVIQIEEQRTTRGVSALLYDAGGVLLGALPDPTKIPPGFVEVSGRPMFSTRGPDVLAVHLNLSLVARITAGPDGQPMLWGPGGKALGRCKAPLNLAAVGIVVADEPAAPAASPPPVIRKPRAA